MQTQLHPTFVTVLVSAVFALVLAAPAAFAAVPAEPPAFPSAVPSQPGALTGPAASTESARAQERYYSSYGDPAPLTPISAPAHDGGVDWTAIGISVGGSCLLIGAVIAMVMRTRRRTGRVRATA